MPNGIVHTLLLDQFFTLTPEFVQLLLPRRPVRAVLS